MKSSDSRRKVLLASLIWGGGVLLSRGVGLLREGVIGRVLGSGEQADIYFASFTLPNYLGYLLASGALSLVFLPLFTRYLEESREEEGWALFSTVANFLLLLGGVATALMWWQMPRLAPLVAPGFGPEKLEGLVRVARILVPAQLGHLLGGLLGATLMARDKHALPALAPVVYALSIVTLGALLGPSLGAEGFAWGVLLGSLLGPLGLPLIGALRLGLRWTPVLRWRDPDFRRYLVLSLPVMLAFSVVLVDEWIVNRIGSTLGEGVVARLQYARTLMKVPMGVFGLATGAAAYPTLSRMLARGEREEAWRLLMSATRVLLVLALATQAGLTAAGPELSALLYGEGRFEAWEHQRIGSLLGWISLGLWAWSAQTVLARGFYAQQNTWMPSLLGSLAVGLGYPLYVWLASLAEAQGLAVASSLVISVYVVTLSIFLRRSLGSDSAGYATVLIKMVIATGVGVAISMSLKDLVGPLPPLVAAPLWGCTAGLCCLATAALLRVRELQDLIDRVKRRLQRRPA